MISRKEIENLAELSRLKLNDTELAGLEKDFSAILEYVGQISAVATKDMPLEKQPIPALRNVMREDEIGNTLRGTSEALVAAAPRSDRGYIVVRKIIQRDEPTL